MTTFRSSVSVSEDTYLNHILNLWDDTHDLDVTPERLSEYISETNNGNSLYHKNSSTKNDVILNGFVDDIIYKLLDFRNATYCLSIPNSNPINEHYVQREYEALKAIYDSTNGSNWDIKLNPVTGKTWNFVTTNETEYNDPCAEKWVGVTCILDKQTGDCTVRMLTLYRMNLSGYIPTEIGYLTSLELILIQYNYLSGGAIPTEIGSLSRLRYLGLPWNNITGKIPTQIGQLKLLQGINLVNNNLANKLPTEIGQLTLLNSILVHTNRLSGSIPEEFQNLIKLKLLSVHSCNLTGKFPTAIARMRALRWMELHQNHFSGQIPKDLNNLKHLWTITLDNNIFSGLLPVEIGQLKKLIWFSASDNNLSGPIPSILGHLTHLIFLGLGYNYMSGTIPTNLGNLKLLWYITLAGNRLTGSIPSELGACQVAVLNLGNNSLSGSIPFELFSTRLITSDRNFTMLPTFDEFTLEVVDLSLNKLSGNIPSSAYSLTSLKWLLLFSNELTGRLPPEISNLHKLVNLDILDNNLTGPIPTELSSLSRLTSLSISKNSFSGEINVYNLVQLRYLDLSRNKLTGSIKSSISNLKNLTTLSLSSNCLSGPLPSTMGHLASLTSLLIGDNKLSGRLPSLQNLRHLKFADFSNNKFSGSLHNIFDTTNQTSILMFSNNLFTGTLPSELLHAPNLRAFIAALNCFDLSYSLPSSICESTSLEYLILDGMSDNKNCKFSLGSKLLVSTRSFNEIECLLAMPALVTLHLSGNQLTGSLSPAVKLSSSLQNLELSHNILGGKIPDNVFNQPWKSLNLGFNKFDGVISSELTSIRNSENITYQNNRLSGPISTSYCNNSFGELRILEGNLFQCGCLHSDYSVVNYECSSRSTNQSFYFLLGFQIFAFAVVGCYVLSRRILQLTADAGVNYLLLSDKDIYTSKSMILVLMIGLIIACCLHATSYSTMSYLYVWYASFGFLAGEVPAAVMVLYIASSTFTIYRIYSSHQFDMNSKSAVLSNEQSSLKLQPMQSSGDSEQADHDIRMSWSLPLRPTMSVSEVTPFSRHVDSANSNSNEQFDLVYVAIYFLLSAFFTLTINIAYVINVNSISGRSLVIVQQSFAIFKAAYQWVPVLIKHRVIDKLEHVPKDTMRIWNKIAHVDNRLRLNLFSIMIAPCIATSIADSNCFRGLTCLVLPLSCPKPITSSALFYTSDPQNLDIEATSTFQFFPLFRPALEIILTGVKTGYAIISNIQRLIISDTTISESSYVVSSNISFQPRFTYYYQCVSSLMTAYVSVFLYFVLLGGIVFPLFRLLIRWIQVCINASLEKNADQLNNIWYASLRTIGKWSIAFMPNVLSRINVATTGSLETFIRSTVKYSFNVDNILSQMRIMRLLGITFGLANPPLGIAIFFCLLSHIYLTNIEIDYYVDHVDHSIREIVVDELKTSLKLLSESDRVEVFEWFKKVDRMAFSLTVVASIFMWLFVFDTIGDTSGFRTATWVCSVTILPLPILVTWLNVYVVPYFSTSSRRQSLDNVPRKDLRLDATTCPLQERLHDGKNDL